MQCGSSCCVNGFLFFIVYSDEVNAAFCPEISLDPEKLFFLIFGAYRVTFCRIGIPTGEVVLTSVCLDLQGC